MTAMSFEKIEPAQPPAPEHPAYRAARMIKELHQENLKKIDEGQIFFKGDVDVTEEIKVACEEQVKVCDAIMARAEGMDPKLHEPSMAILHEVEKTIADVERSGGTLASMMPEIGNYEHDK